MIVTVVVAALLSAAAALTIVRMVRGPSVLDRVVATDMTLALVVCGLGSAAALSRDTFIVPVIVVVALLGAIGSVAVARMLGRETVPEAHGDDLPEEDS